jgi:hypothetical protein
MKSHHILFIIVFALLFIAACSPHEPEVGVKAKYFNSYIKERNQGDERATYYDKQTVKNIIKEGCFPIIPRDTNKNIEALCDPS